MNSISKLVEAINQSNPDSNYAHLMMSLLPSGSAFLVSNTSSQCHQSKIFYASLVSDRWPQAEEVGCINLYCRERKDHQPDQSLGQFILNKYCPKIEINVPRNFLDSLTLAILECKTESVLAVELDVIKPNFSDDSTNLEIVRANFFTSHNCDEQTMRAFRLEAPPN